MFHTRKVTREEARNALIHLLVATRGITEGEANDILREVQFVINDTFAGESDYPDGESVLIDYLGINSDYLWIFDFSKPKGTFREVPLFHEMMEQIDMNTIFPNPSKGE